LRKAKAAKLRKTIAKGEEIPAAELTFAVVVELLELEVEEPVWLDEEV